MENNVNLRWRYPSLEDEQKAIRELREDPKKVREEIQKFRETIKENGIKCRSDDQFLLAFLRVRKYNHKAALKSLRNTLSLYKKYGHLVISKTVQDFQKVDEHQVVHSFKRRDENGQFIFLGIVENWDPSVLSFEELLVLPFLVALKLIPMEEFQINGVVGILDLGGLTFTHVAKMMIYALDVFRAIQGSFPIRFKGLHVVNQNKWLDAPRKLFWPILFEKFKKRIFFHGRDLDSLRLQVSPQLLPLEYGGDIPLREFEKIDYMDTEIVPPFEL